MRSKRLDYQLTIDANDPIVRYGSAEARRELDQWCEMHGARARDCTSLTVTAWTDGSGEVQLEVVERGPDRLPLKDESGMFLKRRIIESPLREPLPISVRAYGK